MKKCTYKLLTTSLLLVATNYCFAQLSINASGSDAIGSGGSVAYSFGQVAYTTNTGANGSIAQGVQQAYEISTSVGVDDKHIAITLQAFPNPTTNFLTLTINDNEFSNLVFQLSDINGKIIEHKKITSTTETISMVDLPSAAYFLKISDNNKEIKLFKIIKN